jgi:hypothetical protein
VHRLRVPRGFATRCLIAAEAAKAGVTFPRAVRERADRVIE